MNKMRVCPICKRRFYPITEIQLYCSGACAKMAMQSIRWKRAGHKAEDKGYKNFEYAINS